MDTSERLESHHKRLEELERKERKTNLAVTALKKVIEKRDDRIEVLRSLVKYANTYEERISLLERTLEQYEQVFRENLPPRPGPPQG